MPNQLSNKEKQDRVHRLEEVDREGNLAYRQAQIGRKDSVLWERRNEKGLWEGLTPGYVRVYAQGPDGLRGVMSEVVIEDVLEDGVAGKIIER